MSDNKNLTPEENANAMKPKKFALVLNDEGSEWIKSAKPRPNQRETVARRASKLNIVKPYNPNT